MNTVFKFVGIALVVGGLLLWVANVVPGPPAFGLSAVPEEALVASPLPAVYDGRVTLTGFILYDDTDALVPYIAYELPNGGMRTKQLIFGDEHGCSPAAGDLPCAPGEQVQSIGLPSGTCITVTGTILGDQILVEHIAS